MRNLTYLRREETAEIDSRLDVLADSFLTLAREITHGGSTPERAARLKELAAQKARLYADRMAIVSVLGQGVWR